MLPSLSSLAAIMQILKLRDSLKRQKIDSMSASVSLVRGEQYMTGHMRSRIMSRKNDTRSSSRSPDMAQEKMSMKDQLFSTTRIRNQKRPYCRKTSSSQWNPSQLSHHRTTSKDRQSIAGIFIPNSVILECSGNIRYSLLTMGMKYLQEYNKVLQNTYS